MRDSRRTLVTLALGLLLFGGWAVHVHAQEVPPAQAAPEDSGGTTASGVEVSSVWDFARKGGPLMIPIGLCSLLALTVIVERVVSLRRLHVIPPSFVSGLRKALDADRDQRALALAHCEASASPIGRIVMAGLKRLGAPAERLEKSIVEAGEHEIAGLRKNLRVLSVIASIAPLLGLLGTIFGMITAFQTVASSAEALGRTELLAKGIYEAMITTAAGLMVAIPALLGYHGLSARVEGLVREMDRITMDFVEVHAGETSVDAVMAREASARVTPRSMAEPGGQAPTDGKAAAIAQLA